MSTCSISSSSIGSCEIKLRDPAKVSLLQRMDQLAEQIQTIHQKNPNFNFRAIRRLNPLLVNFFSIFLTYYPQFPILKKVLLLSWSEQVDLVENLKKKKFSFQDESAYYFLSKYFAKSYCLFCLYCFSQKIDLETQSHIFICRKIADAIKGLAPLKDDLAKLLSNQFFFSFSQMYPEFPILNEVASLFEKEKIELIDQLIERNFLFFDCKIYDFLKEFFKEPVDFKHWDFRKKQRLFK